MTRTPSFETPRFLLRELVREDARALFPTFADEAQMRWWSRAAFASESELADWLCAPGWNGRSWVAIPKQGGGAVARLVATPQGEGACEIGYMVVRERQRQGIAGETLSGLLDLLFHREGHRRAFADVDPDNRASNALLEGLGFTMEGRMRESWLTHIGVRDAFIWGMLAREWPSPGARPG